MAVASLSELRGGECYDLLTRGGAGAGTWLRSGRVSGSGNGRLGT